MQYQKVTIDLAISAQQRWLVYTIVKRGRQGRKYIQVPVYLDISSLERS